MRSRPRVKVLYRPRYAVPGSPFEVEVVLTSKSNTPVDEISFTLVGAERYDYGKTEQRRDLVRQIGRHGPRLLTEGEHRLRTRFDIPRDAMASFQGERASVGYALEVHVSIPWWPDVRNHYLVPVGWRAQEWPELRPGVFASRRGLHGDRPYVEMSLESSVVAMGGEIAGAVSIQKGSKVHGVAVSIHGYEADRLYGLRREIRSFHTRVHEGAPPEGVAIPFWFKLPKEVTPSFRGQVVAVEWEVVATAVLEWASDETVRVPITVTGPTEVPQPKRGWVAPVGRERRAAVWRTVAGAQGLACDAENERMSGSFGPVSLVVHLEQRGSHGLFTVGRASWPALGLDLRLEPRAWADRAMRELVKSDLAFDDRYVAHGREQAQVASWLTREVVEALARFEEARAHDTGAVFAAAAQNVDPERLEAFVASARAAAAVLAEAFAGVRPPAVMAGHLAAWRAFAERHGGRFEPGRMWIHDAMFGMERFEVGTVWTRPDRPDATRVRMVIDPPLGQPYAGETRFTVDMDAIGLEVPAPLADPAEIEPVLDEMAKVSRAARGLAAGPFR
jgi:hypothetical protein